MVRPPSCDPDRGLQENARAAGWMWYYLGEIRTRNGKEISSVGKMTWAEPSTDSPLSRDARGVWVGVGSCRVVKPSKRNLESTDFVDTTVSQVSRDFSL